LNTMCWLNIIGRVRALFERGFLVEANASRKE
jgi:hypothetical protein